MFFYDYIVKFYVFLFRIGILYKYLSYAFILSGITTKLQPPNFGTITDNFRYKNRVILSWMARNARRGQGMQLGPCDGG